MTLVPSLRTMSPPTPNGAMSWARRMGFRARICLWLLVQIETSDDRIALCIDGSHGCRCGPGEADPFAWHVSSGFTQQRRVLGCLRDAPSCPLPAPPLCGTAFEDFFAGFSFVWVDEVHAGAE